MGGAVSIQTVPFAALAQGQAATLIQAHIRKYLVLCRNNNNKKKNNENNNNVNSQRSKHISCTTHNLTSIINEIQFVEGKLPFIHPTSDEANIDVRKILAFQPGYTIHNNASDDAFMRKILIECLINGESIVVDLDHQLDLNTVFTPSGIPFDLLQNPNLAFKKLFYEKILGGNSLKNESARRDTALAMLGLDSDATNKQISKAYKKKLIKAHPDRGGDANTFHLLQKSYRFLIGEEEEDVEGDTGDIITKPSPRFRIIMLSRKFQEPPSDLFTSSLCRKVWVSKAKSIYKNGKAPIVFQYNGTSEWLAKLESDRVAAAWAKRRFMENRTYEDDKMELTHVKNVIIMRIIMRKHRIRRILFFGYALNNHKNKNETYLNMWASKTLLPQLRLKYENEKTAIDENYIDVFVKKEMEACNEITNAMKVIEKQVNDSTSKKKEAENRLYKEMKDFKETEKQIEKLKKQAETKKARLPKRVEKIDTMKKELVELSDETSIKQLKEKIAGRQEAYDGMVKWITKMEQDANELEKNLKDRKDKNYKERVALSRNKESDNEDKDEHVLLNKYKNDFLGKTNIFLNEELDVEKHVESLMEDQNENIVHKIPFEDLYYSVYTGNRGTSQKLRDAAFDGDMTEVKRLLLTGFDLESPDASGTTVLSEAAVGGKVEIVKLLLKLGADPNTSGVYGGTQKRTPLARAVFNNHVEVIKCLLDAGAYVQPVYTVVTPDTKDIQNLLNEWKDEEKSVEAQQKRRFELEKQLDQLSKKWSLADRTTLKLSRLRSRLLQHTMEGNVNEVVNELENFAYEQHEKNPNGKPSISAADIKDANGRALLIIAAWQGHYRLVDMFVNTWKRFMLKSEESKDDKIKSKLKMKGLVFKVDLDATFGPWNGADAGWTALSVASHMGFADIVSLLRQAGANPLLGTTLHKDVFDVVEVCQQKKSSFMDALEWLESANDNDNGKEEDKSSLDGNSEELVLSNVKEALKTTIQVNRSAKKRIALAIKDETQTRMLLLDKVRKVRKNYHERKIKK